MSHWWPYFLAFYGYFSIKKHTGGAALKGLVCWSHATVEECSKLDMDGPPRGTAVAAQAVLLPPPDVFAEHELIARTRLRDGPSDGLGEGDNASFPIVRDNLGV
jgi:hypothetical protein